MLMNQLSKNFLVLNAFRLRIKNRKLASTIPDAEMDKIENYLNSKQSVKF